MNAYGFGAGDRINFSDPMGLCVGPLVVVCVAVLANGPEILAGGAIVAAMANPNPVSEEAALAAKVGETVFTRAGREAHKLWDAGEGFVKEFVLPSGRRADAVSFAQRLVKELKPDNIAAIRRGEAQVAKYAKELTDLTGEVWKGVVETYTRRP